MKPTRALALIFLALVLIVSACQGASPLEPPNCSKGTCVKVDVTNLAKLGEDSTVAVTIHSQSEAPGTKVDLVFSAPDVLVDGQPTQDENRFALKSVDVKPGQPATVTARVRFPREGYFQVVAYATTKDFRNILSSLEVHVTPGGITPNPPLELGPGTPATSVKVDKTETPRPRTATPIPLPTVPLPTNPPYP